MLVEGLQRKLQGVLPRELQREPRGELQRQLQVCASESFMGNRAERFAEHFRFAPEKAPERALVRASWGAWSLRVGPERIPVRTSQGGPQKASGILQGELRREIWISSSQKLTESFRAASGRGLQSRLNELHGELTIIAMVQRS